MTVVTLLTLCRRKHIKLSVVDGKLKVSAPAGALSNEIKQSLRDNKAALLTLLAAENDKLQPLDLATRQSGTAPSYAQQRLWFLHQTGQSSLYHITGSFTVTGELDTMTLTDAFRYLIERHEILRTVYKETDGGLRQCVLDKWAFTVEEFEYAQLADVETEWQKISENFFQKPFNLRNDLMIRVGLLRLDACQARMMICVHHVAADGTSLAIMVQELNHIFTQFSRGVTPERKPLTYQYADFANWQNQNVMTDKPSDAITFWMEYLKGLPEIHALPLDFPRPEQQATKGAIIRTQLPESVKLRLEKVALNQGTTLFILLNSLFSLAIARFSGVEDIVIGTPVAGRTQKDFDRLIGCFVNTLVLRSDVSPERSFKEYLNQCHENTLRAFDYQDLPFDYLVSELNPSRTGQFNPLFQIMFALHNNESANFELSSATFTPIRSVTNTTKFDLSLDAKSHKEGMVLLWRYATQLFEEKTILRLADYFERIVMYVVQASDQLKDVTIQMIWSALSIQEAHPEHNCLRARSTANMNEALAQSSIDHSSLIALECGAVKMSYGQLYLQSGQWANWLVSQGVRPGDRIGVCLESGIPLIVCVLGLMRAGAVYVPMDPAYPEQRLQYMADDSEVQLVITSLSLRDRVTLQNRNIGILEQIDLNGVSQKFDEAVLKGDDEAYVIYTSGSSGLPKGVRISHSNLVSYCNSIQKHYQVGSNERVLQFSSPSFDIFIEELFVTLLNGATLVLPENDRLTTGDFWHRIHDMSISFVSLPTAFWHLLCVHTQKNEIAAELTLRTIIIGGEKMSPDMLIRWQGLVAQRSVRLLNTYGPTETTVVATVYDATHHDSCNGDIPIGVPIEGNICLILDGAGSEVPQGAVGELVILGDKVGLGYVTMPASRDTGFRQHQGLACGAYYTGDLVRLNARGQIDYIRRKDDQIKISGFRVSPGEIETQLISHPEIIAAQVLLQTGDDASERLVAVIVPEQQDCDKEAIISALHAYLSSRLPRYMRPSGYAFFDAIPLTINGKVDKSAILKSPFMTVVSGEGDALNTDTQRRLAALWCSRLSLDSVLTQQSLFFELGGHSLLAARLMADIQSEFKIQVSVRDIFINGQLASMAALIDEALASADVVIATAMNRSQSIQAGQHHCVPASFEQQRIWYIEQLAEQKGIYNIAEYRAFDESIAAERIEQAVSVITQRHQSLRTCFKLSEGVLMQQLASKWQVKLTEVYCDSTQEGKEYLQQQSKAIFCLESEIPIKVFVVQLAGRTLVMPVIHHIAADGWSMEIFWREFRMLLSPDDPILLGELPVQYMDYSVWRSTFLTSQEGMEGVNYWRGMLSGVPDVHGLQTDRPRSDIQNFDGANYVWSLPQTIASGVRMLAKENNASLFMYFHAAIAILFARLTGKGDLVIASPVANRTIPECVDIIGLFANTLPLRTQVDRHQTVSDVLQQVLNVHKNAHIHQDIPFDRIVDEVQPERTTAYNPLAQICLLVDETESEVSHNQPHFVQKQTAKFDLTFKARVAQNGIEVQINYASALFASSTIQRLAGQLSTLMRAMLSAAAQSVHTLQIVSPEEKAQLYAMGEMAAKHFIQADDNTTQVCILDDELRPVPYGSEGQVFLTGETIDEIYCRASPENHVYFEQADRNSILFNTGRQARYNSEGDLTFSQSACHTFWHNSFKCLADRQEIADLSSALVTESGTPKINFTIPATTSAVQSAKIYCLAAFAQLVSRYTGNRFVDIHVLHQEPKGLRAASDWLTLIVDCKENKHKDEIFRQTERAYQGAYRNRNLSGEALLDVARKASGIPSLTLGRFVFSMDCNESELTFAATESSALHLNITSASERLSGSIRCLNGDYTLPLVQQMAGDYNATVTHWLDGSATAADAIRANLISGEYDTTQGLLNSFTNPEAASVALSDFATRCQVNFNNDDEVSQDSPVFNVLNTNLNSVPKGTIGELYVKRNAIDSSLIDGDITTPDKVSKQGIWIPTDILIKCDSQKKLTFIGFKSHCVLRQGRLVEPLQLEKVIKYLLQIEKCAIVAEIRDGEDTFLVAVIQPPSKQTFSETSVRRHLDTRIPAGSAPDVYFFPSQWPVMANGNVDKVALLALFQEQRGTNQSSRRREVIETSLIALWADILKSPSSSILPVSQFFQCGGNSLDIVRLKAVIDPHFSVQIPLAELFQNNVLRDMAGLIEQAQEQGDNVSLIPVLHEKDMSFDASPAQRRMWFIDQLSESKQNYNIVFSPEPGVTYDPEQACSALQNLVVRHEPLRTVFELQKQKLQQHVLPADVAKLHVEHRHQSGMPMPDFVAANIRGLDNYNFNLSEDLPIKVTLLHGDNTSDVMVLICVHHIAFDEWSKDIFVREFLHLYQHVGKQSYTALPSLPLRYIDYTAWEKGLLNDDNNRKAKSYWLNQLIGAPEHHNLPIDFKRPEVQSFDGETFVWQLSDAHTNALHQFAKTHDCTLFVALHGIFALWKMRCSNASDVIIGTAVANRNRPETHDLVGLFVNTLALRTQAKPTMSVKDWMEMAKDINLKAQSYQEVPFDYLIDELNVQRNSAFNPLVQVMLGVSNREQGTIPTRTPQFVKGQTAKFDLLLHALTSSEKIELHLTFPVCLFSQNSIEKFAGQLNETINELTSCEADCELTFELKEGVSDANAYSILAEQASQLDQSVLDYWQSAKESMCDWTGIPRDFPRECKSSELKQAHRMLGATQWVQLQALSNTYKVPVSSILHCAFTVLLARRSGQDNVCLVTQDRTAETENRLGVIGTSVRWQQPVGEAVQQFTRLLSNAWAHSQVKEMADYLLHRKHATSQPKFAQYTLSISSGIPDGDKQWQTNACMTDSGDFEIGIQVTLLDDDAELIINYQSGFFSSGNVHFLMNQYVTLLESIANADWQSTSLNELEAISQDERAAIYRFNQGEIVRESLSDDISDLMKAQFTHQPDKLAVACQDREMTFRELDAASDALIASWGNLSAGSVVAVALPRSVELTIVVAAIVKCGAVYLPLDIRSPQSRVSFILDDADVDLLVGDRSFLGVWPEAMNITHDLLCYRPNPEKNVINTKTDIAYIIYTSGTTGTPKGVVISRASLLHTFVSASVYGDKKVETTICTFNPAFDPSVFELFQCLLRGLSLVMIPQQHVTDLDYWYVQQRRFNVDTAFMTPSLFNFIVNQDITLFSDYRLVTIGGEAANAAMVNRFKLAHQSCALLNLYGPTEATVMATYCLLDAETTSPVPIGRPLPGYQTYVLDEKKRPVPVGCEGELYIGGKGVASGYLNRPQLSRDKFLTNPWSPDNSQMYQTGDKVRFDASGDIIYLGRSDHQVKIRGHRIELDEITSTVNELRFIKDCVVIAREDSDTKQLHCFIRLQSADHLAQSVIDNVNTHLISRLPAYMCPVKYAIVDTFPLTANGKLDAQALPKAELLVSSSGSQRSLSQLEGDLSKIWSQVLNIPEAHIVADSDFFSLGGHSLSLVLLKREIEQAFNVTIPLTVLINMPVLHGMAEYVLEATNDQELSNEKNLSCLRFVSQTHPNIILLPPLSGDFLCYRDLVGTLPDFLNIYVLNITESHEKTIADLVGEFIGELRALQLHGRYHLLGFSMGGVLAFEMANQLQQRELGAVIMLDSTFSAQVLPLSNTCEPHLIKSSEMTVLHNLFREFKGKKATKSDWSVIRKSYEEKGIAAALLAVEEVMPGDTYNRGQSAALSNRFAVGMSNLRACDQYQPKKTECEVALITASKSGKNLRDRNMGTYNINHIGEIASEHYGMLDQSNTKEIWQLIESYMIFRGDLEKSEAGIKK